MSLHLLLKVNNNGRDMPQQYLRKVLTSVAILPTLEGELPLLLAYDGARIGQCGPALKRTVALAQHGYVVHASPQPIGDGCYTQGGVALVIKYHRPGESIVQARLRYRPLP